MKLLEIKKEKFNSNSKAMKKFITFIFPLYPLKLFSNINAIAILAILIALRLVLQKFSIFIPAFSFSISLSWTPLIIIGWIYGPIIGFISGFVTDSLGILMSKSTWFWLYAIQEPMVGFIAGVFGYIHILLKNNNKRGKLISTILFQIILVFFSAFCIYILVFQVSTKVSFESKSKLEEFLFTSGKWIIVGSLIFFFLCMEIMWLIFLKKFPKNFIICSVIISLVCTLSIIFSFLLGPISANEYYKYMHGTDSPSFIKYGIIFYLIPRALKESLKAPVQIYALIILIPIANIYINKLKMTQFLKWKVG